MAKLRVGVLFGGRSTEHDVSKVSARSVINALDTSKYEVIPLGITKSGEWLDIEASAALFSGHYVDNKSEHPNLQPIVPDVDVVFPAVHGTYSEDGTLQGFLELAGLPYVGAGVAASALGMDKLLMKRMFAQAGLPQAPYLGISRHQWRTDNASLSEAIRTQLGFPCFVKPSNGGSSIGVSKVHNADELRPAVEQALSLDRKAVAEAAVIGRELECAVLGNDAPEASVVGEITFNHEFYDYEAKYHDDSTQLVIPAQVPAVISDELRALAVRAFQAVDGAGMGRVDFFLRTADNQLFINEINTIPGFTPMSMYPRMWEATGIAYPALLDRLIELALERHAEGRETYFSNQQPQAAQR